MLSNCHQQSSTNFIQYSFIPEIYPYTDTIYARHLNTTPFFELGEYKTGKLIFYLNGDCSACFAQILEWQKFILEHKDLLDKKKIKTAIVIHSEQLDLLEYNLENIPNSIPIYIDTAQYFSTYNNVPPKQKSITFLDSNNVVIHSTLHHLDKKQYKEILKAASR